jgi:DNA repair protein RadD
VRTFVVDRLSLIHQTSDTFDRYGLDHGVIQGGHPRWRPALPLQICSVQTRGRRRWPDTSVDVFDEAHVLHHDAQKAAWKKGHPSSSA